MTTLLPAEWAPQSAVLLTWPREDGDFAKWFDAVERNFIDIAVAITRYQPVLICCEHAPEKLRKRLVRAPTKTRPTTCSATSRSKDRTTVSRS